MQKNITTKNVKQKTSMTSVARIITTEDIHTDYIGGDNMHYDKRHSTHSLLGCEKSKSGELHFLLHKVEKTNLQVIIKTIEQTDVIFTPDNVGNQTNTNTSQVVPSVVDMTKVPKGIP